MPRPDLFHRPTRRSEPVAVLAFDGELDVAVVPLLLRTVRTAWATSPDVEIDLSRTTFMDCSALGALVGLAHEAGVDGRSLQLRDAADQVGWIVRHFGLTGLLLAGSAQRGNSPEGGPR